MSCPICKQNTKDDNLCSRHSQIFVYDKYLEGYRKKNRLSKINRYIDNHTPWHLTERRLIRILRKIYINIYASFHPLWAVSDKGALMEYDICVPEKKILIEYDGPQHYIFPNRFHKTRGQFEEQQLRDKLKENLAIENDWKLVRIPHSIPVTINSIRKYLKEFNI